MSTKEKKLLLIKRLENAEKVAVPDPEKLSGLIQDTVAILKEDIAHEDESFESVSNTADRFGVTPQAVHKWIKSGKVDYKIIETPGGKHYKIPTDQFINADNSMKKRIERLENIERLRKQVKWTKEDKEDVGPI